MAGLFNTPTIRTARSGDIPVWDAKINQWIPAGVTKDPLKSFPTVALGSGTQFLAPNAQIKSGRNTFVASGATAGPYTVTFSNAFPTQIGSVVFMLEAVLGFFPGYLLASISTTGFTYYVGNASTGAALAAATYTINWIAVGN